MRSSAARIVFVAFISVSAGAAPRLAIPSRGVLANGATYFQDRSALQNWVPIHTNITSFWYTNYGRTNDPWRFYKATTNN